MANFFSELLSKIPGIGSSDGDTAIGIDIGTSAIKIVQLKESDGKIELVTYGALALGPYADKYVGQETDLPINTTVEALTDLLREAKTTTKQGGIAISFSSTLMTVMKLPNVDEKEFKQMVLIEARKYVPIPLEEVSLDWTIISKGQSDGKQDKVEEGKDKEEGVETEDKVDVLMVAVRNDIVERYKRIVSRAELDALFFEVEIFSAIRAVLSREKAPVLAIDMGAASTKLYIIEDNIVQKTHTVNQGSVDITEVIATTLDVDLESAEILKRGMTPEEQTKDRSAEVKEAAEVVSKRILSEVDLFKNEYQHSNRDIERCVLLGGGVLFEGFVEQVENVLSIPTELANPFKEFTAPAFLDDVLEGNGPEFAVATGIALRRLREEN